MRLVTVLALLAATGAAMNAVAAEPRPDAAVHAITLPIPAIELRPGPGRDQAAAFCSICHSTDYIAMQPTFDTRKWGEIVTKMIKVFGAPIPPEIAAEITTYLGRAYGPVTR